MFSFETIDRRKYRFVILMAVCFFVILVINMPKFLLLIARSIDCGAWGGACPILVHEAPGYFESVATVLLLLTIAIATMRRIIDTPISNYWVVFLAVLVFLDLQHLTDFGAYWQENADTGATSIAVPWFLIAAFALIFLLSFAPNRSTYFMQGYVNADPPLGYALAISSIWLLMLSVPNIMIKIAAATGSNSFILTTIKIHQNLADTLPGAVMSPMIPSVIFTVCAVLMTLLGRYSSETEKVEADPVQTHQRLQTAIHTTRAAQRLKGLKL